MYILHTHPSDSCYQKRLENTLPYRLLLPRSLFIKVWPWTTHASITWEQEMHILGPH